MGVLIRVSDTQGECRARDDGYDGFGEMNSEVKKEREREKSDDSNRERISFETESAVLQDE